MNQTNITPADIVFSPNFLGLLKQAILLYKRYFTSYITIYFLVSVPFFILQLLLPGYIAGIVDIIYMPLLAGATFLTLPTAYSYRLVNPMATLQILKPFILLVYILYFISHFLMQFMGLVSILSQANIMLGFIVSVIIFSLFIFYFFSYYFAILWNQIDVKAIVPCLQASYKLISKQFSKILAALMGIYLFSHLFDSVFTLPYILSNTKFMQLWQSLLVDPSGKNNAALNKAVLEQSIQLLSSPTYLLFRYILHAISLPITYIFWSMFFLREVNLQDTTMVSRFLHLSLGETEAVPTETK